MFLRHLLSDPGLHTPRRIARHTFFWLLFYAVTYYMLTISFNPLNHTLAAFLIPARITMGLMLVYYPLVYYIMPRLFFQKKYIAASLSVVVLLFLYAFADYLAEILTLNSCTECLEILKKKQPDYYKYIQSDVKSVILSRVLSLGIVYQLCVYMALPVGIKLGLAYYRQSVASLRLEKENMQLEFNFLRSQINPHFLFNTLNNIYGLILNDRKTESAETVARLAGFMRYTLYESNQSENTVAREIELLKNYIALEKLRLNNTLVNFQYEADDPSVNIPPLIFIPVVENAFKFCVEESGKESWISINLTVKNKRLQCIIANTYTARTFADVGGIGLQNVRKRLMHHYPERYTFDVTTETSVFKITLQINLS